MPVNKNAHERYLIIDRCIASKKYPSAEEIVTQIENYLDKDISLSTFHKDLHQIKKIYNAPIEHDAYHNGYYYSQEGYSIRSSPLTYDEMNTLEFSVSLLQRLKGSSIFTQYENAVKKLIIGNRITQIIGKSENEIIQIEESLKTESNKWLEIILKSIVEKNCLTVTYQGFGREEKKHEFSSYLLKEYRNRWYTVGYVKNAKSTIVLALDRILKIDHCKNAYFIDQTFKPSEYFNYSIGITQIHDVKPEKVLLSFTPSQKPYLLSQPLHHSQKIIKDNKNQFQIQLTVYLSYELRMLILSFGEKVKVIEPSNLQNEIVEIINKMHKNY